MQCQKVASLGGRVSKLSTTPTLRHEEDNIPLERQVLKLHVEPNLKERKDSEIALKPLHRNGRAELSQLQNNRLALSFDSYTPVKYLSSAFGVSLPSSWKGILQSYLFGVMYTSVTFPSYRLTLHPEDPLYSNIKRRLKFTLPLASFQIQTSSIPWSLSFYPIAPCRSQIFTLCADGDIKAVKVWLKNSWVSPFIVNQHGENLLHVGSSKEVPLVESNKLIRRQRGMPMRICATFF